MLELRAASLADTNAIAASLAELARPGDLIVLSGEMGAGKTAFAKGFGAALGVRDQGLPCLGFEITLPVAARRLRWSGGRSLTSHSAS